MKIFLKISSLILAIIGCLLLMLICCFGYIYVTRDHNPMWLVAMFTWGFIDCVTFISSFCLLIESR